MRTPEPPTWRYNQAALDAAWDQTDVPLIQYECPVTEAEAIQLLNEAIDLLCVPHRPWWVRVWDWLKGLG